MSDYAILDLNMMNAPSSTSRTILTGLAILVVFTALVLVALNAYNQQSQPSGAGSLLGKSSATDAYKQGYEAAKQRFSALCPQLNAEVRSVSGTVKSVGTNSFVLTQSSLAVDPKVDGVSDDRTITLDQNTKIFSLSEKSNADFKKELDTFTATLSNLPAGKAMPTPPSPLRETSGSLSQLSVGMMVTVEAKSDVRLLSSIPAVSVRINPK